MDELDLRLAFLDRPAGVVLPEFDKLRRQALFAFSAKSYSLSTAEAIPSFMIQKIVKRARPIGPAQLDLSFHKVKSIQGGKFSGFSNFFGEAAQTGARIGIVGYYHPYCRLFGVYAVYCRRFALNTFAPTASNYLDHEMLNQLVGITPLYRRINAIVTYKGMEKQILQLVGDQQYDLVYLHASVPHGPNIWSEKDNGFTLLKISKDGYFDNLQLADKLLGKIRRAMEQAGLWNNSAVLLTSDHEWRHVYLYDNQRVRKIPFVLKMPNQTRTLEFMPEFAPMLLTKDLLLLIQRGKIATAAEAAEWIDNRRHLAQ